MLNKKTIYCLITILILLIPGIYAIGVAPSKYRIDFEPEMQSTYQFFIRNNAGRDMVAVIFLEENKLNQYFTLLNASIFIPNGETVPFYVEMKLPKTIETPGLNDVYVTVLETSPTDKNNQNLISSFTSVSAIFRIRVPYPGKYIEATLTTPNKNKKDPIEFNIWMVNRGSETISTASTKFKIIDNRGVLYTLDGETQFNINPKEERTFTSTLTTHNLSLGDYKAYAFITYDGNKTNATSTLKIGEFALNITDYTKNFTNGKINRFNVDVLNLWNKQVKEAYAEIQIYNINRTKSFANIETVPKSIESWRTERLEAYWDLTTEVPIGQYLAEITLNYEGKKTKHNVYLSVSNPIIEEEPEIAQPVMLVTDNNISNVRRIYNILIFSMFTLVMLIIIITIINLYFVFKRGKNNVQESNKSARSKKKGKPKR